MNKPDFLSSQTQHARPDGALLAGVCSGLAARLGWNVWAIRGLFILGLFIQAIGTAALYIVLALLLPRFSKDSEPEMALKSDVLSDRKQRIDDLERRFREMEKGSDS